MEEEQDKFLLEMDKYNVNMTWFDADNPPDEMDSIVENVSRDVLTECTMDSFGLGYYNYNHNEWFNSSAGKVKRWAYIGPPK